MKDPIAVPCKARRPARRNLALWQGFVVSAIAAVIVDGRAIADVWVFEPSASIDQRVDDNYRLETEDPLSVSATRAVGELGLSRESANLEFRGLVRVDALMSLNDDDTNELDSNQVAFLETTFLRPRSRIGARMGFKQDTPNRDISADLTDISASASDTGASVTQDQNIDRQKLTFNPSYIYNWSRRTELDFDYQFTQVSHSTPSCEDAYRADNKNEGDVFTVTDELDDYKEHAFKLSARHKLSVLDTFSASVGYSQFEAEEENVLPTFQLDGKIPDPECPTVLRNPRGTTSVNTTRVSFGYERALSQTLKAGGEIGYYVADSDKFGDISETSGYLAKLTVSKDTGLTRYSGRVGLEVYPSDIGDVVESLEVVGDLYRSLGPLLDFSFRVRAYEPDALSDSVNDDAFARRFLSLEPKLIWRFTRAWTAAGSYRYRRQKSQASPETGESNAILLTLKYTPPSAIRDARQTR